VSPLHTEGFRPVRYVAVRQRCHFCFGVIPKASPGSSKGTRGTKAWFDPGTGLWECLPCHEEGSRADAAIVDGAA